MIKKKLSFTYHIFGFGSMKLDALMLDNRFFNERRIFDNTFKVEGG